jgi:NAD(P)H-dependent FMN reductase
MEKLFIPVLIGTTRAKRESHKAAELIHRIGQSIEGIEVQLVDPQNFNFPGDGNDPEGKDPRYTEITKRADGFFIVTPEYSNYVHKPVAFAGASNGHWGGVRAIEALVSSVREMGLVPTYSDVQFPNVQDLFDDEGQLKEQYSKMYGEAIYSAYNELIWMAKSLKWGRDNLGLDCVPATHPPVK